MPVPYFNIVPLSGFTEYTKVVPQLYWNVFSSEQRMKALCERIWKSDCYMDYVAKTLNEWGIEFDDEINAELEEIWTAIDNGLEGAAKEWIAAHLEYIYNHTIKQIYFGLTDDGHFVAYIPESWDDIDFDTIMNYSDPNYGALTLSY